MVLTVVYELYKSPYEFLGKPFQFQNGTHSDGVSMIRARTHWANFCLFCEKICHQLPWTSAPGEFQIYHILSKLTKLQRRRRPASEQDKFLSGVKSDRFVNLHAMI